DTGFSRCIARIGGQFRPLDELGEDPPELVPRNAQADVAVLGLEQPEGTEQGMAVSFWPGYLAGSAELIHQALTDCQYAVDHTDIDILAFTGTLGSPARTRDPEGQEHRRGDVSYAGTDLRRRTARHRTGNAHDAAHSLGNGIVGGPVDVMTLAAPLVAESAQACVDQSRILVAQRRVVEPKALHDAGPVVLDQDVRATDEFQEYLASRGLLQVKDQ